jgi:hypothetical protein
MRAIILITTSKYLKTNQTISLNQLNLHQRILIKVLIRLITIIIQEHLDMKHLKNTLVKQEINQ